MRLYLSILISLVCVNTFAQNENSDSTRSLKEVFQLRGYLKNMQTVSAAPGLLTTDNLIHNRLALRIYPNDAFTIGVEGRNRIIWGETIKAIPGYAQLFNTDNGLLDLTTNIEQNDKIVINSTLDRLWLDWSKGNWNIRAGRQRINWGINTFWNSNDIFNAFNFTDFDYQERAGSDAIRFERFFDGMNSFQVAASQGKDTNSTIAAMLYKFNTNSYDFQVLAGWYKTDYVVGGGWAGNIKEASFKGEVAYFHPSEKIDSVGILNMSVSTDIIVNSKNYTSIGILLNSNGLTSLGVGNAGLINYQVSPKELMPTKYNFLTSHSITLSPLTSLSVILLYSPAAHYTLLMPTFSYSLTTAWDLSIVAQSSFVDLGSYSNIGNAFFARLTWNF